MMASIRRFLAEKYTIILMADLAGRMVRFSIPKNIVKAGFAVIGVFSIFVGYFAYNMFKINLHMEDLDHMRETSMIQKQEIQRFALKVEEFQNQLNRLEKFDKKLRIITALDSGVAGKNDSFGVGGPSTTDNFGASAEKYTEGLLNQLDDDIAKMDSKAAKQEISFHELDGFFKDQSTLLTSTPSIWPTRGWVTSGFGYRVSPFTGMREFHEGLDISTQMGAPVLSPANGVVVDTGRDNGYGNLVEIDHGYGIVTRFGHNSKVLVKRGEHVKRGQVIARVGSTGRSTGPHVHYEVRLNGVPVNPYRYILTD
ncbi:MAG: M23 family metallopeptidase [Nitrospinae bacterium]|nr:M23 family metallopeptidase [Nitrospinota bacterium]